MATRKLQNYYYLMEVMQMLYPKVLLSYGADANAVTTAGFTPLHMAANGSTDCPELCD
jgi:ankyrin repeat protein